MKLTTTTIAAALAYASVVNSAPTAVESDNKNVVRGENDLMEILNNLDALKTKREETVDTLDKREYQIVTDVLRALDNTDLAPQIIEYLATSPNLQPIVINTIVTVLQSGLLDMTTLFQALDESGLVVTVIQDLISDCSLYESLFRTAAGIISDLVDKVQAKLSGNSKRGMIMDSMINRPVQGMNKRDIDFQNVVVNLLESLGNSGLASSVVKSIITDPDYIPFGIELVKTVLQNNALDVGELVDAVKNTDLASNLLKSILNANTFDTVVTNAFAAFAGDCSGGGSTGGGSSGSGSGSGSKGSSTVDPCKKRRRRRRNINHY